MCVVSNLQEFTGVFASILAKSCSDILVEGKCRREETDYMRPKKEI